MDIRLRRWVAGLSLAGVALVAPVAIACGGDDEPSSDEISVQYFDFEYFDPHQSSAAQDWGIEGMVFRGLYALDKDNSVEPEMAADMPEVSDDGLTYTIDLKDGLTWSDGTALEAKDFVAGIVRTCAPEWQSLYAGVIGNVAGCMEYYMATEASGAEKADLQAAIGVKAVDADTIEFTLMSPQPTFPTILTLPVTWPVPTHIVDSPSADWPQPTDLVFNGPFVVESYQQGGSMVFARNDSYEGGELAKLAKVTFRFIEDSAQANNAFRDGEILVARAEKDSLQAVTEEFDDELVAGPATTSVALAMQMSKAPFDNEDFRRALSQATDRETIADELLQGAAIATTSWTPLEILGLDDDPADYNEDIAFDPDAARESLAAAGFPGGEGAPTIEFLIRDDGDNMTVAEFLQAQWKEILGIDLEINAVDAPTIGQRFGTGDFEIVFFGYGHDYPDPESWMQELFRSDGFINLYSCSNEQIDELLEAARFNTDDDERRDQYAEVNELVSEDLCGMAPLYFQSQQYLVSDKVSGPKEFSSSQDRVLPGDWAIEEWTLED